jgi:predicted Zn-dependent protease
MKKRTLQQDLLVAILAAGAVQSGTPAQAASSQLEDWYKKIHSEYVVNKTKLSVEVLRKVVAKAPGSPAALKLAEALMADTKTHPECGRVMANYLVYHPSDLRIRKSLANLLSWRRETWNQSLAEWKKVLATNPRDAQARLAYARLLLWTDQPDLARVEFEKYLALMPNDVNVRLEYIRQLSFKPQTTKIALRKMDALVKSRSNDPNLKLSQALLEYFSGDKQKGFAALQSIAQQHPFDAKADFTLACTPQKLPALAALAEIWTWEHDLDKSRDLFAKCAQALPNNLSIALSYADKCMWTNMQVPQATALLEKHLAKTPDDTQLLQRYAAIVMGTEGGATGSALAALKSYHAHHPPFPVEITLAGNKAMRDSLVLQAQLAISCAQSADATTSIEQYLAKRPSDIYAQLLLAESLSMQPDTREKSASMLSTIFTEHTELLKELPPAKKVWYANLLAGTAGSAIAEQLVSEVIDSAAADVTSELKANALIAKSFLLLSSKQMDAANACLKQAMELDPNGKAEQALARNMSYSEASRKDSIAIFEKLAQSDKDPELVYSYACALLWDKQYEESAKLLRDLLSAEPSNVTYGTALLSALKNGGYLEEAAIQAANMVKLQPESVELLHSYVEVLVEQDEFEKALAAIADSHLSNPTLEVDRLLLTFLTHGAEAALAEFEQTKSSLPVPSLRNLVFLGLSRPIVYPLVSAASEELKRRGEDDRDVLLTLAQLHAWQEDKRPEAIALLKKHLQDHEDDIQARKMLAQFQMWSGDTAGSAETLESLLRQSPNEPEQLLSLAQLHIWSGDKTKQAKAAQMLGQMQVEKDSRNEIERKKLLAQAMETQQRHKEASAMWDELYTQTNDPNYLAEKAKLSSWQGRNGDSIKIYREVLKKDPTNRMALVGLARIMRYHECNFACEELLARARKLYPDDPEVALETATNFKAMGRFDKAMKYADDAIDRATRKPPAVVHSLRSRR